VERSCAAWIADLGIATFADDICQSAGLCQRQILPSTTSFVAQIGSPLNQEYCLIGQGNSLRAQLLTALSQIGSG
jgi:hypothetical protein